MAQYDYMRIPITITPQEIINEYQLMKKVKMASSYVKSDRKFMYFHMLELFQTNYSYRVL